MKHKPRPATHMEKQLGWVGQSLWGSPRWVSVIQVDGVSDMTLAWGLCGGRI